MPTVIINNDNKNDFFRSSSPPVSDDTVYVLEEDISLDGFVFMKLGSNTVFDGSGNTINMGDLTFAGLFETGGIDFDTGSTIKNLGVLGGTNGNNAGAIVREKQKYFKVENCYSTSTISGFGAGGIAGYYAGENGSCTITSCYSTGTISGFGAGGIAGSSAGENGSCTITSCYSTGTIGSGAGGIAGSNAGESGSCTITSCYSTGTIGEGAGGGTDAGGIVGIGAGENGGVCMITSCYSTGTIQGNEAGGIVGSGAGYNDGNITITSCYSTGSIEGIFTGGITGELAGTYGGTCTIISCYSTGSISGVEAGGIAGRNAGKHDGKGSGSCTVSNSFSNYKDGNLTDGEDDGSTPMDGDNKLPTLNQIQEFDYDISMVNTLNIDLDEPYKVDDTRPKLYPLLKIFAEQVPSPYGEQQNYNNVQLFIVENISISTKEDTSIDISLSGTDVDDDTLIYDISMGPTHGTVEISGNVATYDPCLNFFGTDSFTYYANDGSLNSLPGLVSIEVLPVVEDISISTKEDTSIDISLSGTDADDDTLTYDISKGPTHGTVEISGNVATYDPCLNFFGRDSFTYYASDGSLNSKIGTVSINITSVNDKPVVENITISTKEDTSIDILLYGTDADDDTLTYVISTGPTNGSVKISGNVATYDPCLNFNGEDSFTYYASDGSSESLPGIVTIDVAKKPPPRYFGPPFYFYTNQNPRYRTTIIDNTEVLVLPKKAIVYNKPEHNLTKKEYLAWLSRNKYR